jgi:hypothetical protein
MCGRMVGMLRFTTKAILYAIAIVAAYCAAGKLGPTPAGFVMFWVYFGLIFYVVISTKNSPRSAH